MNFKKLAEIAEALNVDEMEIVNFGNEIYNQTINAQGIGVNKAPIFHGEKELYEKIIQDKDAEIAFLRR